MRESFENVKYEAIHETVRSILGRAVFDVQTENLSKDLIRNKFFDGVLLELEVNANYLTINSIDYLSSSAVISFRLFCNDAEQCQGLHDYLETSLGLSKLKKVLLYVLHLPCVVV